VPEACAGLAIVINEIAMTAKQKTMDRKAGRTNLVASNAGASIASPLFTYAVLFIGFTRQNLTIPKKERVKRGSNCIGGSTTA
jgi:hypothetical protein